MASNVAIPVLRKVRPKNIEELSAVNAFIRPGASGLDEYLIGKENNLKIRKLDPRLDRHLAPTFGAIVYQEQIMFLISELMGISFGQADLYRRALEKPNKGKNVKVVAEFNEQVVKKAVERGFDAKVADLVRQLIIDNSGYGFNKSHSIAYAIISYWTAWIKVNYPLIFYTEMFNGNLDSLSAFISEAKKNGITINPPHVCYSKYESIIENKDKNVIRMGLNVAKGIGPAAVDSIIANQPFKNIDDFFERNQLRSVNKRVIEAIISVDGFSNLGLSIEKDDVPDIIKSSFNIKSINNKYELFMNRNQTKFWYEKFNEIASIKSVPNYAIPTSMIKGKYMDAYELATEIDDTIIIPENMLKDFDLELDNVSVYRTRKRPKGFLKLTKEEIKGTPRRKPIVAYNYELSQIKENFMDTYLGEVEELGFSFLPHPLENQLDKIMLYDDVEDGYMMITAGIVKELIERRTKNNKKYYWLMIQSPRDTVRVTIWDNQFKQYNNIIKLHNLLVVKGIKGYGGINLETMKEIKYNN